MSMPLLEGQSDTVVEVDASHVPQQDRRRKTALFGLVVKERGADGEKVRVEYIGPPNPFALWFAIIFGTSNHGDGIHGGVYINHKWVSWSDTNGFIGDGYYELFPRKYE